MHRAPRILMSCARTVIDFEMFEIGLVNFVFVS